MRSDTICLPLVLALAAGCERESLAPLVPDEPEPEPEPEPKPEPPVCPGVAVEDACMVRSSSFQLPGPYRFLGRADANADGRDELIAFSYGWQRTAILSFTLPSEQQEPQFVTLLAFPDHEIYRPVLLDFDGDGRMDFASPTNYYYYDGGDTQKGSLILACWHNLGDLQFKKSAVSYAEFLPTLAAGDIDADGRTDLLSLGYWATGLIKAYVPETDAIEEVALIDFSALQLTGDPRLAAADHNGDAHADFVLMDGSGRAWWLVGGPGYQITVQDLHAPAALTPGSQSFYARDLNADGLADLVAVRATYSAGQPYHSISLALGQPDGSFAALASFEPAHAATSAGLDFDDTPKLAHVGFLDLDGSGQLALVYAHAGRPELIHPRIAQTQGTQPTLVPLDFPAVSLFVDDFEADGDGEDAIYVVTSDIVAVEPSKEHPDGFSYTHHVVRHAPIGSSPDAPP